MENTIQQVNDPWTFGAFIVLLMYLLAKEIIGIWPKLTGKPAKTVTNDQLQLAILEHCRDCTRIADVSRQIELLHKHIDERFDGVGESIQQVWQHLAKV